MTSNNLYSQAFNVDTYPMRSKFVIKIFATLTILMFAISLNTGVAASAPKITTGAACKSLNNKVTFKGKVYTCQKKGSKLVWSKGVTVKSTSSNIGQPPSIKQVAYLPPTEAGSSIDICRIKEVSKSRGMTGAGFPEWDSLTPKTGKVKWALIPIDFADLPGEKDFRPRVDEQMKLLSEWFDTVSEGKFNVEWVVHDSWVRLPGVSLGYRIERSENLDRAANGLKLWTNAMRESDKVFDFTNIQTVNFLLPKGQRFVIETSQGFPWDPGVRDLVTNEGKVDSFSIPGQFMDLPGKEYWSYWAHEFGHAIGLPHIGSSRESNPFQAYDILGTQDGPSRELTGWLRFLAGWLDDSRVHCQETAKLTKNEITLVPLSSREAGIKVAIIPTSPTKAVVIESRRETKFDCKTPRGRNGVLVYTYDATLGHGDTFLKPLTLPNRPFEMDECGQKNQRTEPTQDLLLREGEKATIEGITIEILLHGNRDRIRITRNT